MKSPSKPVAPITGHSALTRPYASGGTHVDDHTALAALAHERQHRVRHEINRFDVDIENAVKGFFIHIQHRLILVRSTGVVNHDVWHTKGIDAGFNHRIYRISIRHIASDRFGIRAQCFGDALTCLRIQIGNNDLRAFAHISRCHAFTKAAACAGDDCDLTLKLSHDVSVSL
jgi:hypothetical protein